MASNLQLPALAATCNEVLPMASLEWLIKSATAISGDILLPTEDDVFLMTSSSSSVLFRRHASRMSSRGVAPYEI